MLKFVNLTDKTFILDGCISLIKTSNTSTTPETPVTETIISTRGVITFPETPSVNSDGVVQFKTTPSVDNNGVLSF